MRILFIFINFFISCSSFANLEALSCSVAVPCYYKHFQYLPKLLESLASQTHIPDEVVISLSQVENLPPNEVDALEIGPWPFSVKIIRRQGIYMEGSNRTMAARNCQSDIIFCIDADDVPHAQRIEAVLQLFEAIPEAEMVLCGHAYCPGEAIICEPAIPFYSVQEYSQVRFELGPHTWLQMLDRSALSRWSTGVHNGSPTLKRNVIDQGYYWTDLKNGADLEFNSRVIDDKYVAFLIQLPLLHYFNGRSSGADVGRDK